MQFPVGMENTPLTLLSSVKFSLEDFFQILWPSQNIQTLQVGEMYAKVANSATFYYSLLVLFTI